MPNIIQTARGVYDVDTVFGCYSYLIRECGLSGDRCAMVNKLYVMANIAELRAESIRPDERLVEMLKKARAIAYGEVEPFTTCEHETDARYVYPKRLSMVIKEIDEALAALTGKGE